MSWQIIDDDDVDNEVDHITDYEDEIDDNIEIRISDEEDDAAEENPQANQTNIINYSRSIVETISKMIDRLKHEEQQEKHKELKKNVKL